MGDKKTKSEQRESKKRQKMKVSGKSVLRIKEILDKKTARNIKKTSDIGRGKN